MKELLLLTPENCDLNKPSKVLDKDLNKIKPFSAGLNFYFETVQYEDFHEVMAKTFKSTDCFIVLGELTDYGRSLEEARKPGPRRKKKGQPTIQDKEGTEIVLDLDDHIIEGFDALNPEPAIKSWLEKKGIDCDVTWQITASQKLNSNEARLRLYLEAPKPLTLAERKAWAQSPDIEADGSVFTCSQPIFIAPPIIEGDSDPIPNRRGFIKGERRCISLPRLSESEIKKYSGYLRGNLQFNFDDSTLPQEVIEGKIYRRYFMPLAFHYVNKLKGDREAIFSIISAKSSLVKSREFDAENVYAYIDDAISKIESETHEKTNEDCLITAKELLLEEPISAAPEFPTDLLSTWPEPWPMLWENFKRVPRELEEALLVPTVLSTNAFFLRANFVTAYNRRPNLFFLNLTPSTGNKDVNSKNVIRDLDLIFKNKGTKSNIFTGILNTESNITADSTFLQSFNEAEELFWINTEATRIFHQIKSKASSVVALSDKIIELVDGHEITGKIKSAGKIKTIQNPNAQVLFYAQPETIERYIDDSTVDSGLFGRALISIVPELKFESDGYEMFKDGGGVYTEIDQEFFAFYTSPQFNLSGLSSNKTVLEPPYQSLEILNNWAREYVAPKMAEDNTLQKVLSRIGNSAEQIYCVVLGICQLHDIYANNDMRQEIDVSVIIPLLEYWTDTKIYAIQHLVNTSLDTLAESILEIVRNAIAGKYKFPSLFDDKCRADYHMVSKAQVMRILKSNTKLIRKLSADGDKKNAIVRINQIIKVLVQNDILMQKNVTIGRSTKICIGLIR